MRMKQKLVAAAAVVGLSALAGSAYAHEFRSFGQGYSVFLGSIGEPVFAGIASGIQIFPQYAYTAVDGSQQSYFVDTGAGDTFTFTRSEILYSNNPLPIIRKPGDIPQGTLVVDTLVSHGPVKPTPIEEKFGSADFAFSQFGPEYNNHFLPKNPGFYGYHIAGTIQVKASNIAGNPNSQGVPGTNTPPPLVHFDQVFTCGAGSQDAPNSEFDCFGQILSIAGGKPPPV